MGHDGCSACVCCCLPFEFSPCINHHPTPRVSPVSHPTPSNHLPTLTPGMCPTELESDCHGEGMKTRSRSINFTLSSHMLR